MAARDATLLEQLREVGQYIDHSLLPAQNEIPGVLAALIYGPDLQSKIRQLRQDGNSDVEIAHEVSHTIAPPDPDAGATVVQGIPVEQHQALVTELAELRGIVERLANQRIATAKTEAGQPPADEPPAPAVPAGPPAPPAPEQPQTPQYPTGFQPQPPNAPGSALAQPGGELTAEQQAHADAQAQAMALAGQGHPVAETADGEQHGVSDPREQELAELRALVEQLTPKDTSA